MVRTALNPMLIAAAVCSFITAPLYASTTSSVRFDYDAVPLAQQQVSQGAAIIRAESSPGSFPGVFGTLGDAARAEGQALAAANTATLRARAEVASRTVQPIGIFGGDIHSARSDAAFSNEMVIGAGSSGLAIGTPIVVNVTLRLDGALRSGHPTSYGSASSVDSPYYLLTSADTDARFSILDPNLQGIVCDETCHTVTGITLAQFDYGGRERFSQMYLTPWDVGAPGELSTESSDSWSYSVYQGGSGGVSRPTEYHGGDFITPTSTQRQFDTGSFSFQYSTTVGATNRLNGSLTVFLQAMGVRYSAFTAADFGNTFDAEFGAVGVSGIEFSGLTSGVTQFDGSITPVPEPHSMALLLTGLGVIALRARRRS